MWRGMFFGEGHAARHVEGHVFDQTWNHAHNGMWMGLAGARLGGFALGTISSTAEPRAPRATPPTPSPARRNAHLTTPSKFFHGAA